MGSSTNTSYYACSQSVIHALIFIKNKLSYSYKAFNIRKIQYKRKTTKTSRNNDVVSSR